MQARQALVKYRATLEDGKPCPLCGSIEHPGNSVEDVGQKLDECAIRLNVFNDEEQTIHAMQHTIEHLQDKTKTQDIRVRERGLSRNSADAALKNHIVAYQWKKFRAG